MPLNYDEPLFPIAPKRKRGSPKVKEVYSIEQVLEAAKALGLSLVVPNRIEETLKQTENSDKLGIVSETKARSKAKSKSKHKTYLIATLHASHIIGGTSYGPGEIRLEPDQDTLFRSLLQQDQACIRGHMDTSQHNPVSRCYLIKPGNGLDRYNKHRKQEVSEAVFNSEQAFLAQDGITAGAFDVAGYQPSFNSQDRSF